MSHVHRKSGIAYTARLVRGVVLLRPVDPKVHPLGKWFQVTAWAFKWPERMAEFNREFKAGDDGRGS